MSHEQRPDRRRDIAVRTMVSAVGAVTLIGGAVLSYALGYKGDDPAHSPLPEWQHAVGWGLLAAGIVLLLGARFTRSRVPHGRAVGVGLACAAVVISAVAVTLSVG
jgi:peptidoglycan/LPS O-acetylase OafA/YrhL